MKYIIKNVTLICFVFIACEPQPERVANLNTFIHPAEFDEHESIWLAWPTYEYMEGRPAYGLVAEIINVLSDKVAVDLMVLSDSAKNDAVNYMKTNGINYSHVRFREIEYGDIWIRDMGPMFLRNNGGQLKVVDFGFNTWGYESPTAEYAMLEEQVDRLVARELGLPIIRSKLVSEGGNHEFNGNGVMIVTEAVEVQRNPHLTRDEIEREFKRIYNVQKVIWLPAGVADDELSFRGTLPGNVFTVITTGGHIDEYARFIDENTILLAEVTEEERAKDSIAAMSYVNLERSYEILKKEKDVNDNPFNIIRVPYTEPIYEIMDDKDAVYQFLKELEYEDGTVIEDGSTIKTIIAASYLNYIISNGVVIIPSYWKEGRSGIMKAKDEKFKEIMQSLYPERKIVQVNPENVNIGGGGMHCISKQMPKFNTN